MVLTGTPAICSQSVLQAPRHLCSKCQFPFTPWPRPYEPGDDFRWYDTVAEIHRSAGSGCALCIQFVKNGRFEKADDTLEEDPSNVGKFAIYTLTDDKPLEEGMLVTIHMYQFVDAVNESGLTKTVWSAKAFLLPAIKQGMNDKVVSYWQ